MKIIGVAFLQAIRVGICSSIHGGSYMAMTGKDSVVLAVDTRFATLKTGMIMTI